MLELLLVALATWQTVEIWRHGSLFAVPRQWARELQTRAAPGPFFSQLLSCPFCLSPWVALFWSLATVRPEFYGPLFVLAATRLAQLGNDLSHDWCRSPAGDTVIEEEFLQVIDQPAEQSSADA